MSESDILLERAARAIAEGRTGEAVALADKAVGLCRTHEARFDALLHRARAEYADAKGETADDALRDRRTRASANLTWHLSEYSKLRLQYNRDWTEHLAEKDVHALWLQFEYSLGAHAAHTF